MPPTALLRDGRVEVTVKIAAAAEAKVHEVAEGLDDVAIEWRAQDAALALGNPTRQARVGTITALTHVGVGRGRPPALKYRAPKAQPSHSVSKALTDDVVSRT